MLVCVPQLLREWLCHSGAFLMSRRSGPESRVSCVCPHPRAPTPPNPSLPGSPASPRSPVLPSPRRAACGRPPLSGGFPKARMKSAEARLSGGTWKPRDTLPARAGDGGLRGGGNQHRFYWQKRHQIGGLINGATFTGTFRPAF